MALLDVDDPIAAQVAAFEMVVILALVVKHTLTTRGGAFLEHVVGHNCSLVNRVNNRSYSARWASQLYLVARLAACQRAWA